MTQEKLITIKTTFKNTEATEALRTYASEKLSNCLKKFLHHDTEAQVVLKVEKNCQIAEISFHSDGHDFAAREESDDLYVAIDKLMDAIAHQLRKNKERMTQHHAK